MAKQGGAIAGNTRKDIEEQIGKKVVTTKNAKTALKSNNFSNEIEEK